MTGDLNLVYTGLHEPPGSWTIIPPDFTVSRHVEALLSVDSTIYIVDNLENVDQRISRGPFTHLAASPNGKSLALLSYTGLLWVVSTDFQRSLAEFETKEVVGVDGPIRQVQWCANDAVIVSWDGLVLLIGPFGDTLQSDIHHRSDHGFISSCRYFYSGSTIVITELDGVRIIGPDACDFVQKVPGTYYDRCGSSSRSSPFSKASTLSIFKPGSTSPSATLYDAWENFSKRSPKADESIRSIRPDLATAVDECIDAAGQEWEPKWQRRLLNVGPCDPTRLRLPTGYSAQAAKFGRSFLDLHNPNDFVNVGQALKVLNAVRVWDIGIPISYSQWVLESPLWDRPHPSQVQLHLFAASCEPLDLTEPTLVGTPDIHVSFFETRCCPEALGMCQDHKIETKRNRCGKRRGITRR